MNCMGMDIHGKAYRLQVNASTAVFRSVVQQHVYTVTDRPWAYSHFDSQLNTINSSSITGDLGFSSTTSTSTKVRTVGFSGFILDEH